MSHGLKAVTEAFPPDQDESLGEAPAFAMLTVCSRVREEVGSKSECSAKRDESNPLQPASEVGAAVWSAI